MPVTQIQAPLTPLFAGVNATIRISQRKPNAGELFSLAPVPITATAAAAAAATAITVTGMTAGVIPGGVYILMANGVLAKTTGPNTTTSIPVEPLPAAIPLNTVGEYDPLPLVPLAAEIPGITPQGVTVDTDVHGQTDSISTKVGRTMRQGTLRTLGGQNDPAVASMVTAADLVSPNSWRVFLITHADGSQDGGTLDVVDEDKRNPVRNVFERAFNIKPVDYQRFAA